MNKMRILLLISILIFGFKAAIDSIPISKSIDIIADYATIRYGNTFIKAKMEPEGTEDFWVNNGFADKRSDGWFWVIPMEQAKAMKASYGDFVHCGSPGASAAKGSLQLLRVFTADPQMREKIKKVIKSSLNSPIIEIRGSKLMIEEHLIGNKKYLASYQNGPENFINISPSEICYLIKDILIVQERFE